MTSCLFSKWDKVLEEIGNLRHSHGIHAKVPEHSDFICQTSAECECYSLTTLCIANICAPNGRSHKQRHRRLLAIKSECTMCSGRQGCFLAWIASSYFKGIICTSCASEGHNIGYLWYTMSANQRLMDTTIGSTCTWECPLPIWYSLTQHALPLFVHLTPGVHEYNHIPNCHLSSFYPRSDPPLVW